MQIAGHKQRLVTGVILLALLTVALVYGNWILRGLILVGSLLSMWELYQMFYPGKTKLVRKALGLVCGAGLVCSVGYFPQASIFFVALVFLACALCFLFDLGTGNTEANINNHMPIILGVLYIPLTLSLALGLSLPEQLLVILVSIGTDAGGYYVGNLFGKHKIWPIVSPKKSWEGSIGGMVLCIAVCLAIGLLYPASGTSLPQFAWWGWALMGVFLNIAAQLGDFFESALKRSLQVKDASQILPGHGGVLDRLDSIIFALLAYTLVRFIYEIIPAVSVAPVIPAV